MFNDRMRSSTRETRGHLSGTMVEIFSVLDHSLTSGNFIINDIKGINLLIGVDLLT